MVYIPPPRQVLKARTLPEQGPGPSRHYRGAGLGTLKAWKCPGCGATNAGRPVSEGCASCGAGAGGQQVRRPGEPLQKLSGEGTVVTTPATGKAGTPPAAGERPVPAAAPRPLSAQLRARPPSVDYDEIERRVARVLERRMGGGYTAVERQTLYNALECYLTLWEDWQIQPDSGLPLDAVRRLADRVVSDDLEQQQEQESERTDAITETTTTSNDPAAGEHADEYAAGDALIDSLDARGAGAVFTPDGGDGPRVPRPAPEFVDADHRGDEVGQDDPAGDGI